NPDLGLSPTLTGYAFTPLPGHQRIEGLLLTNHNLQPSEALRRLVEIGPDALPFLLDALADRAPTKLKMEHGAVGGTMLFGGELAGSPVNGEEERVRSAPWLGTDGTFSPKSGLYRVKVGDVCFVAVGQIVGRPYQAVRYQPSFMIVLNSPVQNPELRERV